MPARKRALQCPIDYAVTIFGDRWSMLILRDLLLANRRHYGELAAAKEGIASNVLAARLRKLQASGLIVARRASDDGRRIFYEVTDKALDLVPVLLEIGRWSAKHAETAAPPAWVRRFDADRDELVRDLIRAARQRQAAHASRTE